MPRTAVLYSVCAALSAPLATPAPLAPRGTRQSDPLTGFLDQTPAFDPAEPEPVPDFDFDQSLPADFDP
jgi:hypothetical protein